MLLAASNVFLVPGIVLGVLGVILIGITIFWPDPSKTMVKAVSPVERTPLGRAAAEHEITGPVTMFSRSITWPAMVDRDAGELEDGERRRVIDGLGIVGDAWCATILAKAFDEEEGELRVAAIEALGQSEGDVVGPVLERAYASYSVPERYAAIDGASRRAQVPLLEKGLRDTDGTVALAAAYGLHRAHRHDIIETQLAGRTDPRAEEIRRVLPILA